MIYQRTFTLAASVCELAMFACALVLFVASPAQLNAQSGEPWTAPERRARRANPVPATAQAVASGRVIFERECRPCHGPSGRGDGSKAAGLKTKPSDLTDARVADQTDGALFWKITEGRGDMPNTNTLTEEQRWMVVDYVRTLGRTQASRH